MVLLLTNPKSVAMLNYWVKKAFTTADTPCKKQANSLGEPSEPLFMQAIQGFKKNLLTTPCQT
jgi:hypothetical protein